MGAHSEITEQLSLLIVWGQPFLTAYHYTVGEREIPPENAMSFP